MYVALVIQHAKCMRPIIMSPVASLDLPHFPPLSHKRQDFRGGGLLDTTCVMRFSLQPLTFHILRTIQRDITMYTSLHVMCPSFVSDIIKLEFSRQVFEKF